MKLSVSTYSYFKTRFSLYHILRTAQAQGFSSVEIADMAPFPSAIKKLYYKRIALFAKKIGMEIDAYVFSANLAYPKDEQKETEKVKKQIDIAHILGAKLIRHDVFVGAKVPEDFSAVLPDIARRVKSITDYAKSLGIVTTVENHGLYLQEAEKLKALYDAVNDENFKLLGDMGNFLCGDVDPKEAFYTLAPYYAHIHAKDFVYKDKDDKNTTGYFKTRGGNHLKGTVVGKGIVPISDDIKRLKEVGYEGCIVLEFEGAEEPLSAITEGTKFLKKLIEEN